MTTPEDLAADAMKRRQKKLEEQKKADAAKPADEFTVAKQPTQVTGTN